MDPGVRQDEDLSGGGSLYGTSSRSATPSYNGIHKGLRAFVSDSENLVHSISAELRHDIEVRPVDRSVQELSSVTSVLVP